MPHSLTVETGVAEAIHRPLSIIAAPERGRRGAGACPCAFFAELDKLSSGVIFPPAGPDSTLGRISETLSPASVFDQWHLDIGPGLERFERGQERLLAKTGSERPQVGLMSS